MIDMFVYACVCDTVKLFVMPKKVKAYYIRISIILFMTTPSTPVTYTLYLDSCGDSGWCAPYGKSCVKYYVVAGLALTSEADLKASSEVNRILAKYVGSATWRGYKLELIYHDLIRGRGIYEGLDHPVRKAMADEVFGLLSQLNPVLFATVVDKIRLKERYGVNAHDPKLYGIRATIHRFAMFLTNQVNGIGNVMMDAEEYKKDRLIQEMITTFKIMGIIIRGWDYQPRYEERLTRILNNIGFADSTMITGIQLADVCCRTTWQHFEHSKSDRYAELSPYWNRSATKVYEPSVVPK
jgi:hypothetical protein